MMIRYSKWLPTSASLQGVLDAARELGFSPTVCLREAEGRVEHAVFVDEDWLRTTLGMTEKELEEESD
jgi:hypothetical protein